MKQSGSFSALDRQGSYDGKKRSATRLICKNKCVATEEKCVLKTFKKGNVF